MPKLTWIGKDAVEKHHQDVPTHLLEPVPELSCGDSGSGNLIVQGDNLIALKALLPRYAGKVKCIYIDPPYNTGNEGWAYNDNVNSPEIKKWLGKVVGAEAEDLSRHDKWLCMMYPRLVLLKQFLREDGVIFVSIDDNEYAYLKLLMDEIFGEKSFVATICVKMSHLSGVKMSHADKKPPKIKEYVLIYAKDKEFFRLKPVYEESDWSKALDRYTQFIINKNEPFENWNVIPVRQAAIQANVDVKDKGEFESFLIENAENIFRTARNKSLEITGIRNKFTQIFSKRGLIKLIYNDEEVLFASEKMKEVDGKLLPVNVLGDIWLDIGINNLHNEGGIEFKNGKKPEKEIERIIEMSTKPNDIVLDSFLGSGTTAAVAHKMNRRYVGIEMGEHAETHCQNRLKKVVEGEQGGISKLVSWTGGGGFQFCRLSAEPLFTADGEVRADVTFAQLASYVWFNETKMGYEGKGDSPLLGEFKGRAIYLLYNGILKDKKPEGGNILTRAVFNSLPPFEGQKVIYAAAYQGGVNWIKKEQIIFKQTPYALETKI